MKKKLYMAPAIMNILITTADLIMGSSDVNAGGTQVATGNDHGSGNAWGGRLCQGRLLEHGR
ncbi:MAG: hypothetical protein ACFNLG_00255 [Prevotella nigrescens]|uniref:hypothetical protein n=1 Tax=Prevotella nigrescens TaxID=28133 RepID=UPI00360B2BE8